jgi:DNA-binding transcriptional LysR family regulator
LQLAEPIADTLARTRGVLASATRFDAAKSSRRFVIGAPDAISSVILPPLMHALEQVAPKIDLSVRALMPQDALAALDAREVDLAIAPLEDVPVRFAWREIYTEDFVIAMRAGHPLAKRLTLDRYCAATHLLVSITDNPGGLVDDALKRVGRSRRVALSVPGFVFALAVVAETDLLAALPRMLVARYSAHMPVVHAEAPIKLPRSSIRVIVPRPAMADAGTAWLLDLISGVWQTQNRKSSGSAVKARKRRR